MKINFYKPNHPILKKYIEGYYFMAKDDNDEPLKYCTFPDNYFIISACQNITFSRENNTIEIDCSEEENLIIDFVSRCNSPVEVHYKKSINEVTVYFKPLGIYHFFEANEAQFLQDEIISSDFEEFMKNILNETDQKIQIEKLENYWLSKFQEKDLEKIEKIIEDLDSDLNIEKIAKKHQISRQYLNKISTKYLGKPASEFRKIQRFRNSVNQNKNVKNLTELSYENLFYDQSHFIKDFKDLTKIQPRKFFEKVNTEQKNIWLFI
ncbi:AraC family transcriptional regulator [Chryseobacterium sp.]|uniref:AraC family transcriptional regulator n=1 Tax=Chryseobacterium sp. TaxID=1871047 RepID=UPI0028991246|nr:AraC family transcriptional regulator [Chryseobacterium sp.]